MDKRILFALTFLFFAFPLEAQYSLSDFRKLHSLQGMWEMKKDKYSIIEFWVSVSDSLIDGKDYFVAEGDTTLAEQVSLRFLNGKIEYVPTVEGQNNGLPVSFVLNAVEGDKYVFINPEHDFPTEICYELKGVRQLRAAVSGDIDGERKTLEYLFERISPK